MFVHYQPPGDDREFAYINEIELVEGETDV